MKGILVPISFLKISQKGKGVELLLPAFSWK